MEAIVRKWWKIATIPVALALIGCQHSPYISDNNRRARHLESLKAKYDEPGQSRVKTGNFDDGY